LAYWLLSANILDPVSQPTSICGLTRQIAQCKSLACVHDGDFAVCDDAGVVTPSNVTERKFPCGPVYVKVQEAISCTCSLSPSRSLTVSVIDGDSGAPVEKATVKIVGASAIMGITDSNGESVLTIPSSLASPVVQVSHAGGKYLPSSKPVGPSTGSVSIYLFKVATPVQIDPAIGNVLSLSDDPLDPAAGVVTLQISANAFFTDSGNALAPGPVDLSVNFVEPDKDIGTKAPGVFQSTDESGNIVPIETMGVFTLSASDAAGNALSASGIGVSVGFGFRLFVLRNDGTWQLEPVPSTSRRRRQATPGLNTIVGEIVINPDNVTWYNIDKFPENTPCWFKTYIIDINSGNEVKDDGLTHKIHNFVAITERNGSRSVLQLSDSWYSSQVCFEARCDNENDNVLYPSIPIGFITVDVHRVIQVRATPLQLSDYQLPVQTRLNALSYTVEASDRVRLQLESSVDGPFFSNKDACKTASFTDGGNVLAFTVAMPTSNSNPFGSSTDRCVARAKVRLNYIGDRPLAIGTFNAVSVWGDGQYYIDKQLYDVDPQTPTLTFCFIYRCSETGDLTNVTILVEDSADPFVYKYTYGCHINFQAEVISSTRGGYYFNGVSDASAALEQCAAETNDQKVVAERRCPINWRRSNATTPATTRPVMF